MRHVNGDRGRERERLKMQKQHINFVGKSVAGGIYIPQNIKNDYSTIYGMQSMIIQIKEQRQNYLRLKIHHFNFMAEPGNANLILT